MKSILQDITFVIILISISVVIVGFLYKAVRAGYRKAMIEHLQNMTDYSAGSIQKVKLVSTPPIVEGRNPDIGVHTITHIPPNIAQSENKYALNVPSVDGIPLSAFPNIDMKSPWLLANIQTAEIPEKEGCRKSATGLFYECGVPPANTCE